MKSALGSKAEHKLHNTESSREYLWNLPGMCGIAMHEVRPAVSTGREDDEVQWIRRGTTWELSDKKASFAETETKRE